MKLDETSQQMEYINVNEDLLIDCRDQNSIMSQFLGFPYGVFSKITKATQMLNLSPFNSINIHANIISGSFVNGTRTHLLHSFVPDNHFGYKIYEKPPNIIYHPLNTYEITDLELSIREEKNNLIDFNEEDICICVIVKRDSH